ncbi:MAG: M20 family metallopeptidase [Anaerolineae bacterium]|nr:M20 family metallopeptidase [Anaerolineae bacterium]
MTSGQRILAYLRDHQPAMEALLTELVELESPSNDKLAVDRLARFIAARLEAIGAAVEILPQTEAGDHVRARWGQGEGGTLLLCHMDTVWDVGTLARRPVRMEEGRLYGPGALDMKGGICNALWAIGALQELDLLPSRRVTLLLTSDEETGSRTSRAVLQAEAQLHDRVLVLEPAQPPNAALKTWRKGTGAYRVTATGRAAHAGVDHAKGINAIEELAYQILVLQSLTDYEVGTTVNVGVVGGGSRSNVVPQEARARVDVRVMDEIQAARLDARIRGLRPHLEGATLEISGGIGRPPMVRTPAVAALYAQAAALAAEMGFAVAEAGSGGGSDGNFTAALGIPTLDGLGAAGDGAHAEHEHVVLSSLPERAALLAAMLHAS